MKILSVFIDESGDFGKTNEHNAYYIVTFVFHNQSNNIQQQIDKLQTSIHTAGFNVEYIHTAPLIL